MCNTWPRIRPKPIRTVRPPTPQKIMDSILHVRHLISVIKLQINQTGRQFCVEERIYSVSFHIGKIGLLSISSPAACVQVPRNPRRYYFSQIVNLTEQCNGTTKTATTDWRWILYIHKFINISFSLYALYSLTSFTTSSNPTFKNLLKIYMKF
jgi:hypothetical protein